MSSQQEELGLNLTYEPAIVGEGMLRVSILAQVPLLLRDLGQDPDRVVREAGLDPALLRDPENTIPFRTAGLLLQRSVARTGCSHFGLLVGQRGGLEILGVVGLLVRHSPDVGTALRNLVRCLLFHDRGASPSLSIEGQAALLGYAIFGKDVPASDQAYAAAIAVACMIMRDLCGAGWNPSEVLFPFRKPRDTGPFKAFFRARLRFGAGHGALAFPATWLDHPLRGADPNVRAAVETLLAGISAADSREVAGQVKRAVLSLLMSGSVTESEVARAFAMHHRTLGRRLQAEGTTFQNILKDVRYDVACQLLRDTDNTVGEIATALGYGGGSPFTRAFRQWSGLPPVEWRKRNSGKPGGG